MPTKTLKAFGKPTPFFSFGKHKVNFLGNPQTGELYINRTQMDAILGLSVEAQAKRAILAQESPETFVIYKLGSDVYEPIELGLLCARQLILPSLFNLFLSAVKVDWEYYCKNPENESLQATTVFSAYTKHLIEAGVFV